ncbi:DUF6053 domain-containing protein [Lysobacter enzymogenes]|uniref:DUF6053 domain-containing protein n=1 Tax=Lysobacter enzymogenes TaxID=69 RepID=UPI003D189104
MSARRATRSKGIGPEGPPTRARAKAGPRRPAAASRRRTGRATIAVCCSPACGSPVRGVRQRAGRVRPALSPDSTPRRAA